MKPASKNLHNKDMILSCRFRMSNYLDKKNNHMKNSGHFFLFLDSLAR